MANTVIEKLGVTSICLETMGNILYLQSLHNISVVDKNFLQYAHRDGIRNVRILFVKVRKKEDIYSSY